MREDRIIPEPPISQHLVAYLEQRFCVNHPPRERETFDQLRWRGGQASVLEHLRALLERQTNGESDDVSPIPTEASGGPA